MRLGRLQGGDSGSITMVGAILYLAFDEPKGPRQASELTEFQKDVLRRLAHCGPAWTWGNVTFLFHKFGLPDTRGKMKEFVKRL